MRPFNEVLREAKQGNRPAVDVNVVDPADVVNPVVRNPIPKRNRQKPQPQGPALPSSAQRAKTFSQSFGTPTGANPFTGKATYTPPKDLTKLPSSAKGTVDQSAYSKVNVGDLETKRSVRTAEVPVSDTKTGRVGVRAATPEGVRNYALSQGGFARSGRNMPASEFASVRARADAIAANPNSPEYKKIEARINQEVGGRRIPRGRSSPAGIAADAAFRQSLGLDTPEGAAANRAFAKDMEKLRRQTRGERDLLAAINNVDEKPSGRQGSQGRRPAVSVSQTPSQVVANTQQTQRITQTPTKVETPKGHNARIRPGARQVSTPTPTSAKPAAPAPTPTPAKPVAAPRAGGRVRLRTTRGSVITPRALEKALTNNRQQTALAQQAQNTKAAIQSAKTLKNVARVGSGVAAYLDFQRASQEVRAQGGGDRRAAARGALEAGARIIGGGAGFVAGTPLGPAGQVLGATGGGELAVRKTGQAFERIFGKPGDPVTRQSVTSNLGALYRQKVPKSIRSQVSPQAKQTFKGFLNTAADLANKGFKGYQKAKKVLNFSQGDN